MTGPAKSLVDEGLAAVLVSTPAWVPWLADLNQVLTTASLVVGLTLGIGRLAMMLRKRS